MTRCGSLAGIVFIAGMLSASSSGAAARRQDSGPNDEAIRARLTARYEIVALRDGVGLIPRRRTGDVRLIEIADGDVSINGVVVTGRELRERLDDDAELILRLSYVDADTQRALLGIGGEVQRPGLEAPERPTRPEAPQPAAPTGGRRRSQRRVGVFGDVRVSSDEVVNEDVVAVLGSGHVDGEVRGNVVVVLGSLELGQHAIVHDDVTVVGGSLRQHPGAQVRGEVREIGFLGPGISVGDLPSLPHLGDFRWRFLGPWGSFFRFAGLFSTVFRLALLSLLAAIVVLVAPGLVRRIADQAAAEPFKAGITGFLAELLFVPAVLLTVILLLVTIIGIPLLVLVPFGIMAFMIMFLVGFTGVAYSVGRWAQARFGWRGDSTYVAVILGIATLLGITLLGRVVGLAGGLFGFFAFLVAGLGIMIEYLAWTTGLGAALLAKFAPRTGMTTAPPAVAPPAAPTVMPEAP